LQINNYASNFIFQAYIHAHSKTTGVFVHPRHNFIRLVYTKKKYTNKEQLQVQRKIRKNGSLGDQRLRFIHLHY